MSISGLSAVAAGIVFLVSGACIVVFFATETEAWGRANDATIALFAALMIPPVLEIYQRYSPGSRWVVALATALGVAGLLVVVVTSGLTALAKLDWLLSAKIGAFGFGGFLAWMIWACTLVLRQGGLPDALAWFGLATAGVMGIAVAMSIRFIRIHGSFSGEVQPAIQMWVVFGVAFLCLPAWVIWLGLSLS
jgi:hypothetical protein